MGSVRLLAVLAAVLALCGCGTVSAPPGGFSDAEMAEMQSQESDRLWDYTGLEDELRPSDPPTDFVSYSEWTTEFVICMNAAGFDNYHAEQGGYSFDSDGPQGEAELLVFFVCSMSHTIDYEENGYLNWAQEEFRYEYFEEVLVPCLLSHDVALFQAPTREEFHSDLSYWNPYLAVPEADQSRVTNDARLHDDCPAVPPGVTDPGYYGYYG